MEQLAGLTRTRCIKLDTVRPQMGETGRHGRQRGWGPQAPSENRGGWISLDKLSCFLLIGVLFVAAASPAEAAPTRRPVDNPAPGPEDAAAIFLGDGTSQRIFAVDGAGDVNGDGIADVVVGARESLSGSGEIWVIFGPVTGDVALATVAQPDGIPGIRIIGGADDGEVVTAAGDMNNDGYDDVLILGAHEPDGYVVFGGTESRTVDLGDIALAGGNADGFLITNGGTAIASGGQREVDAIGDFDGDGYDDIAVLGGSYDLFVVYGAAESRAIDLTGAVSGDESRATRLIVAETSGSEFFSAVAGAGDTDGDDFDDLFVGLPSMESGRGAAFLVYGQADRTSRNIADGEALRIQGDLYTSLGKDVAGIGDRTGDGVGELAVVWGRIPWDGQYAEDLKNRVTIHDGTNLATLATFEGVIGTPILWIDDAGDLDGDERGDLVIVLQHTADGNYFQSAHAILDPLHGGIVPDLDATKRWHVTSQTKAYTGGLGDVTGDGLADLGLGDWKASPDGVSDGAAFVYAGQIRPYGLEPPELDLTPSPAGTLEVVRVLVHADDTGSGDTVITGTEVQVDSGEWLPLEAQDGAYDEVIETGEGTLSFNTVGTRRICARAFDTEGDESGHSCQDLEVVSSDGPVLRAIEVNQTIQTWRNTIPLYEGKDTVVRVFFETGGPTSPTEMTGLLHGTASGEALSGSPLEPVNGPVAVVEDASVLDDPDTDKNESVRADPDGSLNFILPRSWTKPSNQVLELSFEPSITSGLTCAEPDGKPDCVDVVVFEAPDRPIAEFVSIPYDSNEVRALRRSDDAAGTFKLVSDGDFSDALDVEATAEEVEGAVEAVLGARDGRVIVDGRNEGYDIITLRGKHEDLTLNTSGLTGGAITLEITQLGGEFTAPGERELREQRLRVTDAFPTDVVDYRYRDVGSFNRAPTLLKANRRLANMRWMDRSLNPVRYPPNLRSWGFLRHRWPTSTKSGMALLKTAATYLNGFGLPGDGGRPRNIGVHEAAHNYGRAHAVVEHQGANSVGICGSKYSRLASNLHPWVEEIPGVENESATEDKWEFTWPTIGPLGAGVDEEVWGFSPRAYESGFEHLAVVDPRQSTALMSYCNAPDAGQDRWPSTYTYQRLREVLANAGEPAGATETESTLSRGELEEFILVSGSVDAIDGTLVIEPAVRLLGMDQPYEAGDVSVALVDGSGAEIASRSVALLLDGDHENLQFGLGPEDGFFFAAVPVPAATEPAGLVVTDTTTGESASLGASPNPPTVSITSPAPASTASGAIAIEWDAEDADGDPLEITVLLSYDDGATWETLAMGLEGGASFDAPTRFLAASQTARVRVLVSDGFHTAEATSGAFEIDAGAPHPGITMPANGATVVAGAPMILRGDAWDPEEGRLAGTALEWSSDRDGILGTGETVALDNGLSLGSHQITLTATDSDGRTGSTTSSVVAGTGLDLIFADDFEVH
ncbi:hypothetical protein G4Y73_02195 [Wenzhouxiangella sp. XN201]|uniref:FG-GAP repeat protein n=1 Tax=Wenzhouxiangella sp. XN201 TaxID=2710755 RepID=UPI0013C5E913|nr:FG-GAP repeat protein [Wenzhouxiangella sp. XN201]NEZ02957.1 hypothetical protein [Wenzhouxiangella sp. XN201]